ncbi:hypothetical protein [Chryseobacterium ginsengisoli]
MKQLIIITILSLSMINCKGQQNDTLKSNNSIKDTMEYITIEEFNKRNYINNQGDFVQQFKGSNNIDFIQNIHKKGTPITLIKAFYEKTKSIKGTGQRFNNFVYGIWKEYDESGKLIKETNWDKNYLFKVEDLCKLIKAEYGVDLTIVSEPNKNSVERRYEEDYKKHCYVVIFRHLPLDEGNDARFKEIYIDGETGKIMYEDGWTWGDLPKSKTPVPRKGEKEKKTSGVYKTYQGKDYTQAEWKIFEQEQYNEHLRKTGRADLVKPTETPKTENKKSFLADENEVKPKKKGFWG